MTADVVLVNGRITTLDPARPEASAVLLSGSDIVAVGDDADVLARAGAGAQVIDVHGATVTPGLVDSHTHPVLGLDAVRGVDLSGCNDLAAVQEALHAAGGSRPADAWVLGWGLDPNVFGDAPVTGAVVDAAVAGRPALVHLFDGHSAVASAEALRRGGIDGARRFTSTASVGVDAHGDPTGLLNEPDAVDLIRALVPPESFPQRLARLTETLDRMAACGLTGGHAMDASGDTIELLTALAEQDRLPLRLRISPWVGPDDVAAGGDLAPLLRSQGVGGALWSVAGVKLFLDGTIDGGTAWLSAPDRDGCSTAPYWPDPAHYADVVARLHRAGVPTATHAIGDAAVTFALDTLAGLDPRATAATPGGSGAALRLRHRIEHVETLPDDQVARFAQLGVVASMQPTHATDYTRADHSDNWSRRLGRVRADRGWRCADVLRSGAIVTLGSDWPVAPFDPRAVMAAAQLRRPARRPDLAPVQPAQALTGPEALYGYTRAPALAVGADAVAGRVTPGHRADLTVWADDPTRVDPRDLPDLAVHATVTAGVVHRHTDDLA